MTYAREVILYNIDTNLHFCQQKVLVFKTKLRVLPGEPYLSQNWGSRLKLPHSNEYYDVRTIAIGPGVEARQCLKGRCFKTYFLHTLSSLNRLTDLECFTIIYVKSMGQYLVYFVLR